MASITARKLSRETADVIDQLLTTGEPVLIMRGGHPVAALTRVDAQKVEEIALASASTVTARLDEADAAAGTHELSTLAEIFDEGDRGDRSEPQYLHGQYLQEPAGLDDLFAASETVVQQLAGMWAERLADQPLSQTSSASKSAEASRESLIDRELALLARYMSATLQNAVRAALARDSPQYARVTIGRGIAGIYELRDQAAGELLSVELDMKAADAQMPDSLA